jgi:hypothetical protein
MPIPVRPDFDGTRLHRLARESKAAAQVRRLMALAAIYDGGAVAWVRQRRCGLGRHRTIAPLLIPGCPPSVLSRKYRLRLNPELDFWESEADGTADQANVR